MSFVKRGQHVKAKESIGDNFTRGKKYEVLEVGYNREKKSVELQLSTDHGEIITVSPKQFLLPKITMLGQDFRYDQKVKFYVKPLKMLLREGWEQPEKGGLKKTSAYYRFTKKKMSACDRIITGNIRVNPSFKACLRDEETGWHFDESMVQYIIEDVFEFKPIDKEIAGVGIRGGTNGSIKVGRYTFRDADNRKLLELLLKHHNWTVEGKNE